VIAGDGRNDTDKESELEELASSNQLAAIEQLSQEDLVEKEELLLKEYLGQTALIAWHDLQKYYAHGNVIQVANELDLVAVAVRLGLDDTITFQGWIDGGEVSSVQDAQALQWYNDNAQLWTVVAAPWVLVQERRSQES